MKKEEKWLLGIIIFIIIYFIIISSLIKIDTYMTETVNKSFAYIEAPKPIIELVEEFESKKLINQIVYGYSSTVDQTDSSPFITANGTRVRTGIIANNCYDFGTRVEINNGIFEVQDRMNSRYGCEVWDIWFETREEALNWGKKITEITVMNK